MKFLLVLLTGFICFSGLLQAQSPSPQKSPTASPTPADDRPASLLPAEARFYAEKGNSAFARDDLNAAQINYEKVIALAPENLLGMVNLGAVYYRQKKYPESEAILTKAVSRQFKLSAGWMTLGLIYLEQDRLDEAVAAFSFASAFDEKNARVHNYLGVAAGRKGWYDMAESELRKALEIDPKLNEPNFNLAVFYLERKPPAVELARRHYQRALDPGAERDPVVEKKLEKK